MDNNSIVLMAIIIISATFIGICLIKKRIDLIVDFIVRASIGTVGICLLNFILRSKPYSINVGINGVTVLTNGLLGLPGFILLYGLAIYYLFK